MSKIERGRFKSVYGIFESEITIDELVTFIPGPDFFQRVAQFMTQILSRKFMQPDGGELWSVELQK